MIDVPMVRLDPDLPMPSYARSGDAGADLVARVGVVLAPSERAAVPTGIAVAIPRGYAGFVQPRSGVAMKHGVTVINTPGLIDSGYRDEVKVALVNLSTEPYEIRRGDRIAQLVIQAVEQVSFVPVDDLDSTDREGGFGHTGR